MGGPLPSFEPFSDYSHTNRGGMSKDPGPLPSLGRESHKVSPPEHTHTHNHTHQQATHSTEGHPSTKPLHPCMCFPLPHSTTPCSGVPEYHPASGIWAIQWVPSS